MTKALVTGASGFIGYHVARRLVERGDEVSCLVRRTSNVERLRPLGVQLIEGDVTDAASVKRAVAGCETVYHVAGLTRALQSRDLFNTNVGGTRNVAEACAAAGCPPVMVMISSLAAAGPSPPDRPKREDDPPVPVSHYGRSKLQAERAAAKLADRFPFSIVRPPIVLGEADRNGLDLFRTVVRMRLHLVPSWRRYHYSVIHATDLASLLILAAERGERVEPPRQSDDPHAHDPHGHDPHGHDPHGHGSKGIYHAAAEKDVSYADLGRLIARCDRKHVFALPIASPVIWTVAACNEGLGHVCRRPFYLNLDKAREATAGHWICSAERARRQLNFRPAAPLLDRLRQTLQWYRAEHWL